MLGFLGVRTQYVIVMTIFCQEAVPCFLLDGVEPCQMLLPILHCKKFGLQHMLAWGHAFCMLLAFVHCALKGHIIDCPILLGCHSNDPLGRHGTRHGKRFAASFATTALFLFPSRSATFTPASSLATQGDNSVREAQKISQKESRVKETRLYSTRRFASHGAWHQEVGRIVNRRARCRV